MGAGATGVALAAGELGFAAFEERGDAFFVVFAHEAFAEQLRGVADVVVDPVGGAEQHRVAVRMKDDARSAGFDHVREATVMLAPAQILVIDFDTATQEITLQ